jgi:hypothetical protein
VISQIAEENILCLLARNAEPVVEGAIGRLYLQALVEHYQRVNHCIQDGFRVFPLINRLPETRTESGKIREREYHAAHLSIGSSVRSDANEKPSVAMVHLSARWHSIDHHLHAHLVDIRETHQRLYVASLPANVRCVDPEHFHCRSIETSHPAVASEHDDRDIDRVQDANHISAYRVLGRTRSLYLTGLWNPDFGFAMYGH